MATQRSFDGILWPVGEVHPPFIHQTWTIVRITNVIGGHQSMNMYTPWDIHDPLSIVYCTSTMYVLCFHHHLCTCNLTYP